MPVEMLALVHKRGLSRGNDTTTLWILPSTQAASAMRGIFVLLPFTAAIRKVRTILLTENHYLSLLVCSKRPAPS